MCVTDAHAPAHALSSSNSGRVGEHACSNNAMETAPNIFTIRPRRSRASPIGTSVNMPMA